jgi:hypothetical protein
MTEKIKRYRQGALVPSNAWDSLRRDISFCWNIMHEQRDLNYAISLRFHEILIISIMVRRVF